MVIATIGGGLGNQLFQYAMALRLARHRNVELKLNLANYRDGTDVRPKFLQSFFRKLGLFNMCVTATEATDAEIARLKDPFSKKTTVARIVRRIRRLKPGLWWPPTHIREKQFRFDPAMMDLPGDAYLEGFWQTEKYFLDIAPLVRQEFKPKDPAILEYAANYVAKLRQLGPIVSLHIRRGDWAHGYETLKNSKGAKSKELEHYINLWGEPLGMEYISVAIRKFGSDHHFLVFSDTAKDIEWCRQNIKMEGLSPDRLHFSEGHTDLQDMALMSACDHNIIAASTFSWWAAWLNDRPGRRVISPTKWGNPASGMVPDDLVPSDWEMI
jgi:hypothetical protein